MNDRQLRTFITAVDSGSFNQAEDILYMSRQAIRKQITSLEQEVGIQLIARTNHGISLTPAGTVFYKSSKKIVRGIDDMLKKCREVSVPDTVIRIENPKHPRLLLENAFDEFARQYPNIRQEVVLRPITENFKAIADRLLSKQIDITECTPHQELQIPGISYLKLLDMQFQCIVSSGHPLALKACVTLKDLKNRSITVSNHNETELLQALEPLTDRISIADSNSTQDIFNVCYNHGVYISKAYFAESMSPLISIPLEFNAHKECGIFYLTDHSDAVESFLQVVKNIYSPNTTD